MLVFALHNADLNGQSWPSQRPRDGARSDIAHTRSSNANCRDPEVT